MKRFFCVFILVCVSIPVQAQISRLDTRFNIKRAQTTRRVSPRSTPEPKRVSAKVTSPLVRQQTKQQESPYITFDELYNNETIQLPRWFWEEVKDINGKLKTKLSPSDYLEILKGEHHLYGRYRTRDEYNKDIKNNPPRTDLDSEEKFKLLSVLREKLNDILASPDDDMLFARPRFLPSKRRGIHFRKNLRYTNDTVTFSDEKYILTSKQGLSSGSSTLTTFWDARTGLETAQFASPSCAHPCAVRRWDEQDNIYLFYAIRSDAWWLNWYAGVGDCDLLVRPYYHDFQSFDFNKVQNPNLSAQNTVLPTGTLASMVNPIPNYMRPGDRVEKPWYSSQDTIPAQVHILRTNPVLQVRWDEAEAGKASGVVFSLSSLVQRNTPEERRTSKDDKFLRYLIKNSMLPSPSYDGGDEYDRVDLGKSSGDYTLFTRFQTCYDEGSEPSRGLIGLFIRNHGVFLFPTDGGRVEDVGRLHIKDMGKLEQYSNCTNGTKLERGSMFAQNIADHYLLNVAPRPRCMNINISSDGKHAELTLGLNIASHDERLYILELDLENLSYVTKKSWKYENQKLVPVWLPDGRIFLKPESDIQYSIFRLNDRWKEKKLADLYIENAYNYVIVLPNGHYAGSPGCESMLEAGDGERVVGMRALAPWRNRPAEVLEAIGGNADDIAALRETTKRWLRKQGFDPDNMPQEPTLVQFPVAEVKMPNLFSKENTARFEVRLKASSHNIKKLEVRVDGVLIPQQFDTGLSVSSGEERIVTVGVPLASGQNWIEVTPIDDQGISGDTSRFRTIYKGSYPSDLFIVALGVSDYDDPDLKLQYAAKDAKDIAAAFEKYGTGRKHLLVLTDKEVKDKSVLEKVRIFLSAASLEDRIVFYVAGHGMLDDQLNYYYAPAGFNINRISETGIPMDDLLACIQNSKARKRILLLDTCHSGVLGEEGEEKLALSGVQLPHGVRAIQHRGMKVKKTIGALNTKQKKRYIEDLFSRGGVQRGINIIAGSAGAEYALESTEWKNGVFTAAIIGAMKGDSFVKDSDGDGMISVEELQQHIVTTVQQHTGGRQQPSIVSEEGAENMILIEGGLYRKLSDLISLRKWSELEELLYDKSRSYHEGWFGMLIEKAIQENVPVSVLKQLIQNRAMLTQSYGTALEAFLNSENGEYKSHRTEIVKLFADNGDIKDCRYSLADIAQAGTDISGSSFTTTPSAGQIYTDLQPMIDRMAALRCREATSALYQKRLLTLLPLIRDGADVDITLPETKGNTALHYACGIGSWSITQWLVEHGANVNAVTDKGATPLDCVGSDSAQQIRALLISRGARKNK